MWQRNDSTGTIWWEYYQVVDQFGNILLPANGIKLIEGEWSTGSYQALPDGQGGCIVVLEDQRDGTWDIWGQRVDSLGNRQWGSTGMPLVIMPGQTEAGPKDFNNDSLGNFFLSWCGGSITTGGMFIQKFNASGTTLWGPIGVQVTTYYAYGQDYQQAVPDMNGGIIEVFQSQISQFGSGTFFIQHLNAAGHALLPHNGIRLRDLNGQAMAGSLHDGVPDGTGGGVWSSQHPSYPNTYVRVWRLNGQGQMQWIWTSENISWDQGITDMIRHPLDGTVWLTNYRSDVQWIFRFALNGTQLFGHGIPYGGYFVPVSDGVISTFRQLTISPYYLRSQRIDNGGHVKWSSDVFLIASLINQPPTSNGADGIVVAFQDDQYWPVDIGNILAQRVNNDGTLGTPFKYRPQSAPGIDSQSSGQISYVLEQAGPVKIEIFDLLGRKVALLEKGYRETGTYRVPWNDRGLASGIYIIRIEAVGLTQTKKIVVVR